MSRKTPATLRWGFLCVFSLSTFFYILFAALPLQVFPLQKRPSFLGDSLFLQVHFTPQEKLLWERRFLLPFINILFPEVQGKEHLATPCDMFFSSSGFPENETEKHLFDVPFMHGNFSMKDPGTPFLHEMFFSSSSSFFRWIDWLYARKTREFFRFPKNKNVDYTCAAFFDDGGFLTEKLFFQEEGEEERSSLQIEGNVVVALPGKIVFEFSVLNYGALGRLFPLNRAPSGEDEIYLPPVVLSPCIAEGGCAETAFLARCAQEFFLAREKAPLFFRGELGGLARKIFDEILQISSPCAFALGGKAHIGGIFFPGVVWGCKQEEGLQGCKKIYRLWKRLRFTIKPPSPLPGYPCGGYAFYPATFLAAASSRDIIVGGATKDSLNITNFPESRYHSFFGEKKALFWGVLNVGPLKKTLEELFLEGIFLQHAPFVVVDRLRKIQESFLQTAPFGMLGCAFFPDNTGIFILSGDVF